MFRSRLTPPSRDRDVTRLLRTWGRGEQAALDPRQARVMELRYFGGLTIGEVAEALGVSHATVEREWRTARLWLRRELEAGGGAG